ncbi:MAG: hypothetical protein GY822_22790 [Deltaproteobacteria bacterium]|nr:hypothetical protein [Deltaproteobacteria bacterium]
MFSQSTSLFFTHKSPLLRRQQTLNGTSARTFRLNRLGLDRFKLGIFRLGIFSTFALTGCGPDVDCEALCNRNMACEAIFDAPDDLDGEKIASGERTELEACTMGCQDHPLVTVESANCVDGLDGLDTRDPSVCQSQTLQCFDVVTDG